MKKLITAIMVLSLVLFSGSMLAKGGHSGKSGDSVKSCKSDKSARSEKKGKKGKKGKKNSKKKKGKSSCDIEDDNYNYNYNDDSCVVSLADPVIIIRSGGASGVIVDVDLSGVACSNDATEINDVADALLDDFKTFNIMVFNFCDRPHSSIPIDPTSEIVDSTTGSVDVVYSFSCSARPT